MNKTFCILPWIHTHIKPNGDVHLCSRKSIPLGNLNNNSINDIIHSDKMDGIRQDMRDGEFIEGCEKCYHEESLSHASQRLLLNNWFNEYLNNNTILPWKEDSDSSSYDATNDLDWLEIFKDTPITLRWIALHGSNVCNLACRGCYSLLSTKWRKDEGKLGINPHSLQNPDLSWYELNFNDIDVITMYGGEPFYMKQSDQLTTEIKDYSSNKVLQYFTNGSILPKNETLELWKCIKKLILFISIDGYGTDNDYFRYGSKWNDIEKNLTYYVTEGEKYGWDIKISTLINIHNVDRLDVLHNWLIDQGIKQDAIMYNLCIIPQELDIRNLPQEYKDTIIKRYRTINLPQHIKNLVINQLNQEPSISFIAMSAFNKKLDVIRNQINPNALIAKMLK